MLQSENCWNLLRMWLADEGFAGETVFLADEELRRRGFGPLLDNLCANFNNNNKEIKNEMRSV